MALYTILHFFFPAIHYAYFADIFCREVRLWARNRSPSQTWILPSNPRLELHRD